MDMNEVIAQITWTVQDLHDAFLSEYNREPSEEEIDLILDNLNFESIEETGIEAGWNIIERVVQDSKELFEQLNNKKVESQMEIYGFTPFGYKGSIVEVEVDLRRGIPSIDFVGLSDDACKNSRENIKAAFEASQLDYPVERILVGLSPADMRKDGYYFDLPMAMAIIQSQSKDYPDEKVMILGNLTKSGEIEPLGATQAAIQTAIENDITHFIVPKGMKLLFPENAKVLEVTDLKEAATLSKDLDNFKSVENARTITNPNEVIFPSIDESESLGQDIIDKHSDIVKSIEIAVAGKHNILLTGAHDCGKSLILEKLIPELTPELTEEENLSVTRLKSLAGLIRPNRQVSATGPAPFRMPHHSATLEGLYGGGIYCRPGEVCLSHNGTFFLDEASEFQNSALQMLHVPMRNKHIQLARAGRSTIYPADFQLAIATLPSPDGNYLAENKICISSEKTIELHWKKFSRFIENIEIKNYLEVEGNNSRIRGEDVTIDKMKERIATAYKIQRERGIYNSHLNPEQISEYCKLEDSCKDFYQKIIDTGLPSNQIHNLLKVSLTIANMDGREQIKSKDLKEAYDFSMNSKMRMIMNDVLGYNIDELKIPDMQKKRDLPEIGR